MLNLFNSVRKETARAKCELYLCFELNDASPHNHTTYIANVFAAAAGLRHTATVISFILRPYPTQQAG